MYAEMGINFLVKEINENGEGRIPDYFNKKASTLLQNFHDKYTKYMRESSKENNYFRYVFNDKTEDFEEIFKLLDTMKDEIHIVIDVEKCFEDKDFDAAVAYVLIFPKECYYYDDYPDDEKYYSLKNSCKYCHDSVKDFMETTFIKPDSSVSKILRDKIIGASTFAREPILSIPLYQSLLESGIDSNVFRPVHTKTGKLLGHKLYGNDHILPALSVSDRRMLLKTSCLECGKTIFYPDVNDESKLSPFQRRFTNVIVGDYPLKNDVITINSEGLSKLEPVNLTNEYFFSARYVIVNKWLFNLIAEAVPRVKRSSMPIFQSDELWDYIDWEFDPRIYDDTTGEWRMPE